MPSHVTIALWKARAAWMLSGLLSPFVLVPLFSALFVLELTADRWEFLHIYLLCVACSVGVPAAYIGVNVYAGRITDIHVRLLEQRRGPFRAGLVGLLVQATALWYVQAHPTLVAYGFCVFFSGLAFAYISENWKISVHTGTLGSLLAGAMVILDWSALWLLLELPLIWARAHRRRHHPRQGIGGALLGFVPTWICLVFSSGL